MAQYTVQSPDGNTIVIEGPEGASQADVIAKAQELYKGPQASVSVSQPSAPVVQPPVMLPPENPVWQSTGGGAAMGRPRFIDRTNIQPEPRPLESALAGVTKSVIDPVVGAAQLATGGNLGTSEFAQNLAQQAKPYEEANPASYVGGRIGGAVLPGVGMAKSIGMIPSFARANALPAGAGLGSNIAQGLTFGATSGALTPEETGKTGGDLYAEQLRKATVDAAIGGAIPVAGKALSVGNKALGLNIGTKFANAPSAQELADESKRLFTQAKQSGVELNTKEFTSTMKTIGNDLRQEGYDPDLYPKVAVALKQLQSKTPKDFAELSTLRKFIQGAQKSTDEQEKRLGSILKTEFDNYVATIPETSIVGGSKEGLTAWKQARDTYSKMSKAEVFDDMLANAQLDKSKFSMSGIENSLSQQLRQLAKSDRKMRLFTATEQQAIRDAAEGSNVQNVLRFFGKFAPTSTVGAITPLLVTAANPIVGTTLAAGALGSRAAATQIRKASVNKLAAMMRAGAAPEVINQQRMTPEQQRMARLLMTQMLGTATNQQGD